MRVREREKVMLLAAMTPTQDLNKQHYVRVCVCATGFGRVSEINEQ